MAETKNSANVPTLLGPVRVERVAVSRPVFYANNTITMVNQWDVQFVFALIHEIAPGQLSSADQAVVIMTPEHALAFSKSLQKSLEAFTKAQGEIRVVEAVQVPPGHEAGPTKG